MRPRAALLALLVAGSASAAAAPSAARPRPFAPGFKKVLIIVLENTDYALAAKMPFLAELSKRGAALTNYHAIAHPSQPNYVALIAGDTLGVTNDDKKDLPLNLRHVGDRLEEKGLSWASYAEGYPGNCYRKAYAGRYARKHEPFIGFLDVQTVPARCSRIKPASDFARDAAAGLLPALTLYVPDLDDDGHDTGARVADRWLRKFMGPLLSDADFMRDTLVAVTFDEDSGTKDNRILTVLVGAGVLPGSVSVVPYDHYSLLRTIEDAFGLRSLNRKDLTARRIAGVWRNE